MKTVSVPQQHDPDALVCCLGEGSKIKTIGLGGIGAIVVHYLSLFLHSLGIPIRLVLVDGDEYQPRNIQRVAFSTLGNKAEVKAEEINRLLRPSAVSVMAIPDYVGENNIYKLIRDGDHVFLCVDNHPTRKLVADHCARLENVALFNGGNDGVDPPGERGTYGDVQIAIRRDGKDVTLPIARFHPEIHNPAGLVPTKENCLQQALSTPQILFANLGVASAMLSAFFAYTCGRLTYQEVKLDILDARMLPQFPLPPDGCPEPLPAPHGECGPSES